MRVIIAGGGSGGHIFPALSIAEEILRLNPNYQVLFVGTREGLEKKTVLARGHDLEFISSGGVMGKGITKRLMGMALALKGFLESLVIIRRYSPDVVVGMGGYVSGPVVCAAFLLSVPSLICEQNSIPGITNRLLGRLVKRVLVTFEESVKYFPAKKTLVAGNPVRSQILAQGGRGEARKDGITVLVFGGSQGAHRLNLALPKAFAILGRPDVDVIHQTGENEREDVEKTYEWYGIKAEVLAFIEDMGNAYARADLVIGRAGAGTIAELTALGKPSILVPYPFSAYNHQLENARIIEKLGGAVIVEDKDAVPEKLAQVLTKLLKAEILQDMNKKARKLGKPDAAARIVDEIHKLAQCRH